MSSYKLLFPFVDTSNIYISNLVYDNKFRPILYDGVSLLEMTTPVAFLKNLSGKALDILYSPGGKLVVSQKVKVFLERLKENHYFEFIPVKFENKKLPPYFVLNILELVDAFDFKNSKYELFDELEPNGNPVIRDVIKMEIDTSKTKNRMLFSMLNYEGDTFIHTDLANAMIKNGITGLLLDPLIGHK
jgi:hypothetical protein